jgi:hypothetical protein
MFNVSAQREGLVGPTSTAKGNGLAVPQGAGVFDWPGFKARRDACVNRPGLPLVFACSIMHQPPTHTPTPSPYAHPRRLLILNVLPVPPPRYVKKLNASYLNNWKGAGIQLVLGVASFVDVRTVAVALANDESAEGGGVAGVREFTATHVLVACGGAPDMPKISGVEHCITSDGFFDLEQQV